ncbi:hypothetical protein [Klebsiella pneumoniae]|uniref:hypothetical protein n=1 Tax=Klebsiella pneumoniae TaxID=573 RepID=UPI0035581802
MLKLRRIQGDKALYNTLLGERGAVDAGFMTDAVRNATTRNMAPVTELNNSVMICLLSCQQVQQLHAEVNYSQPSNQALAQK